MLEIGEALGGAYAISERHHGVFLETLDAAGWQRVLPALWRGLDALREQPAHWPQWLLNQPGLADGPAGLWGPQLLGELVDHPDERVSGWRQVLAASRDLDELFIAGQRRIAELLEACPATPHLLHADLLNRNAWSATTRPGSSPFSTGAARSPATSFTTSRGSPFGHRGTSDSPPLTSDPKRSTTTSSMPWRSLL